MEEEKGPSTYSLRATIEHHKARRHIGLVVPCRFIWESIQRKGVRRARRGQLRHHAVGHSGEASGLEFRIWEMMNIYDPVQVRGWVTRTTSNELNAVIAGMDDCEPCGAGTSTTGGYVEHGGCPQQPAHSDPVYRQSEEIEQDKRPASDFVQR